MDETLLEKYAAQKRAADEMAAAAAKIRDEIMGGDLMTEVNAKIDAAKGSLDDIDVKLAALAEQRKALIDKKNVILEGIAPELDMVKTLTGRGTAVRRSTVAGKKLKDPRSGEVYESWADATRKLGIAKPSQSQRKVFINELGYELIEID